MRRLFWLPLLMLAATNWVCAGDEAVARPDDPASYADILQQWPEAVRRAAMTLTDRDDERWAWTFRTRTDEGTLVERWDPSRPEEERTWLLERDGKPVAEEEARKHARKRAKERAERRPEDADRRYQRTRAWLETLRFERLETTADCPAGTSAWQVTSVKPENNFDGMPLRDRIRNRVLTALQGRVWVSEGDRPGFVRMELENTGDVNPYFSVHLRTLKLRIDLVRPEFPDSPWLPASLSGHVKGRFLVVGSLDETFEAEFWDYTPVGPRSPLVHR